MASESSPPRTGLSPLPLLRALGALMASTGEESAVLDEAVNLVRAALGAERCSILLCDPEANELYVAASTGIDTAIANSIRIPLGHGIAGHVALSGQPRLGTVTRNTDERGYTNRSFLSVPIPRRQPATDIQGVINVTNKMEGALTRADLEILEAVAGLLAVSIERNQLADRMRRTNRDLRRALEAIPAGILIVGAQGHFQVSNARARTLLGCRGDQPCLSVDASQLGAPIRARILELVRTTIASGSEVLEVFEAAPLPRPLQVRAMPFVLEADQGSEVLLVLEDLTLSRELEDLRQIDELKNNFLAMVSHELRTPLTSIRGAVRLLEGMYSENLDGTQQGLVKIIGGNIERLISVVNAILDTNLLETGQMELSHHDFDLLEVVGELLELRQGEFEAKHLTLLWDRPEGSLIIHGDRERLAKAIDAVLHNAIKYNDMGGSIEIATACRGNTLTLAIEDSGPGIQEEFHEAIFQKFFQIEDPMTRKAGGQGVGLFLARGIATLHGGNLRVQDRQGPGVAFVFELPIS
ncbi:MAG: ATP-binding protein [Sumerlaeia bacterium]